MSASSTETEIKLAVADVRTARRLLHSVGFTVSRSRVFERNIIFDTPRLTLRHSSKLLRLRQAGRKVSVTYKGQPTVDRHKSREELEITVSRASTMDAIFERLGFRPVFRYEKYRTEYHLSRGAGVATLDETPVGIYLELEGSPRWIDRTAGKMGFEERDYITSSYARLYLNWCRKNRIKPSDMVFHKPA